MDLFLFILLSVVVSLWCYLGYRSALKQIEFAEQVEKMLDHYRQLERSYDSLSHSAKPLLRRMELIDKYEPFLTMLSYKREHRVGFFFRFLLPAVVIGPLIHLFARKPSV